MKTITLKTVERTYKNNGQHAQQAIEFTLTDTISKADNRPFWTGGDVLDIQVKSQKATICNGTDLNAHLDLDGANRYAYVNKDFTKAYIMSRTEYTEFINCFGYVDHDSKTKKAKIRLRTESRAMVEWLETQI